MTTTFSRRYVQASEDYPQAYARHCKEVYGFAPPDIERLLHMHDRLSYGGKLNQNDVKHLQRLHPNNAAAMPGVVAAFNAAHGPQRADLFIAALSADPAGLDGRFGDVGDAYRHVKKVAETFQTEDYASAIEAKRDGGVIKPDRPVRVEDPLSTRSLIERQLEPRGLREAVEMVNAGDERAAYLTRQLAADRLDAAADKLADPDASLRDALAASYDSAHTEAVATDQGWLSPEE
jgi:hypothetical protein